MCHELGQGGVAKDVIVWEANVSDVEVDQLRAEVVVGAEGHRKVDLHQGAEGTAPDA